MASCGICKNPLKQKKTLTCCKCGKGFHCTCLDINKAKMERITADTWKCKNCPEQKRKRRRVDEDGREGKLSLEDITKKVFKIEENQKSQEEIFNKKIELLNEKLDTNRRLVNEQNDALNGILGITDSILKFNKTLGKRVEFLKNRRVNFVEIYGVPMQPQEDVLSAVNEVRKALGMDVVDSMFDAYHRMGDRTAHNYIYVNEDLTPARRRLLGTGRLLKSDNDDRHQWAIGYKTVLAENGVESLVNVSARITSLTEIMYAAVVYVSITDHSVIRLGVRDGGRGSCTVSWRSRYSATDLITPKLPLSWREFSDSKLLSYVAHTRRTFLSSFWMNSSRLPHASRTVLLFRTICLNLAYFPLCVKRRPSIIVTPTQPATPAPSNVESSLPDGPHHNTPKSTCLTEIQAENSSLRTQVAELRKQLHDVLDHTIESDRRLLQFTDELFVVNPSTSSSVAETVPIEPGEQRSSECKNKQCTEIRDLVNSLKTTIEVLEAKIELLKSGNSSCTFKEAKEENSTQWTVCRNKKNQTIKIQNK
ncbi:hypothetical protein J6590_056124 [Homalodisca vitripennis]|nr:hypothetical protein J6590_056124 [Homalodisca vitripennis]